MRITTASLAMSLTLVTGCATSPHGPDVQQSFARIIERVPTGTTFRQTSSSNDGLRVGLAVTGGLAGALVGAVIDAGANSRDVTVYDYLVLTEDGRNITIRNLALAIPMHEGNCVKVYEASRSSYPRIEPHTGCR